MAAKNIKNKIKDFFFVNPTKKMRVRQLSRNLKLPLPSVIRYTKELVSEGILKVVNIGDIRFYTADRGSDEFLLEKRLYNIRQLYHSGLISYLKQELANPTIILFGSYSRGEDIESSDIDLYIETSSKKSINLTKFEEKLNRRIQIFRYKSIHKISNKLLANNILNGITLNGFVEVFR